MSMSTNLVHSWVSLIRDSAASRPKWRKPGEGRISTKDTKRSEIEYSEEASAVIQTTAQSKLDEIATKAKLPEMTFEVTGKHEYGDQEQSRVMATAMWAQVEGQRRVARLWVQMKIRPTRPVSNSPTSSSVGFVSRAAKK
jgi:hypothetical protein